MKPKRLSSSPNLPHQKRSFLLGPGEQILEQSKQPVLNETNSETIPKRFGFVSKTISEFCPFVFNISIQYWYSFMTRIWRNLRNVRGMDIPLTNRSQRFVPAWYKWENIQTVKSGPSWQDFYSTPCLFPSLTILLIFHFACVNITLWLFRWVKHNWNLFWKIKIL